jgi:hypothetical protein
MHFSFLSLLTIAVTTTSGLPHRPSKDRFGNADPTRACLFAIDQLGKNVGFIVPITKNTNGVPQVLVKSRLQLLDAD